MALVESEDCVKRVRVARNEATEKTTEPGYPLSARRYKPPTAKNEEGRHERYSQEEENWRCFDKAATYDRDRQAWKGSRS